MFSQLRMREEQALLAHDYALETARAEGIEQGLERGLERGRAEGIEKGREEGLEQGLERGKLFAFLDMVRQGLLTSEVASQQLGMTVAEFEELLKEHHEEELKKYRETSKDKVRKPWLEFFGNKPFTQQPERAISQADQLLDYKSWSEEDRKMFSQLRMREEQALLAQDYALETARAEGIEQGLERGRAEGIERGLERGRAEGIEEGLKVGLVNLVRQGLLTSEVASEQLGMTVAEFEALL